MKPNTQEKLERIAKTKSFKRLRNKVLKKYPGAYTKRLPDGTFEVCTANGYKICNPELHLPPCQSVREAWETAALGLWFTGMIVKSFNAFNDDKIYKKLVKENKEVED